LFELNEAEALDLDEKDPLGTNRAKFLIPPNPRGDGEAAYLAGNSLGLQPRQARLDLEAELDDWAKFGVGGHTKNRKPWVTYHEGLRGPAARLVGALPEETVVMNTLTVNLHLMMVSFYRPTSRRYRILIEDGTFPSDSYAVRSQAQFHGYDPDDAVLRVTPRDGEAVVRTEDVLDLIEREGDSIALIMLGAVNYYTGELMDIPAITAAGRAAGIVVGWDLAHAVGNVELKMHDWDVDWAAWCSYKYLNSGPGAIAGAFVHQRHLTDDSLVKFSGWWSTNLATRFEMKPILDVVHTADAWQLSNPPILAMAPVESSMKIFDEIGMPALRQRSIRLTGYLETALAAALTDIPARLITPTDPERRGAQLSVQIIGADAEHISTRMRDEFGVFTDARQPDVVRFAPAPLYCTFHDCWRAANALHQVMRTDS
jgi:kynureninase